MNAPFLSAGPCPRNEGGVDPVFKGGRLFVSLFESFLARVSDRSKFAWEVEGSVRPEGKKLVEESAAFIS